MENNENNVIDGAYNSLFSAYFDKITDLQKKSNSTRFIAIGRLENLIKDLEELNTNEDIKIAKSNVTSTQYESIDQETFDLLSRSIDLKKARDIRQRIGSQAEVGSMIGMGGKYLSAIETGRKDLVSTDICKRYIRFLLDNGYAS